ncbi:hypothetical protein D3C71_1997140 [compost metagenome]
MLGSLLKFAEELESRLDIVLEYAYKVQLIVHTAHALERMVIGDGLIYGGDPQELDEQLRKVVEEACAQLSGGLQAELTPDECYYICELLRIVYEQKSPRGSSV